MRQLSPTRSTSSGRMSAASSAPPRTRVASGADRISASSASASGSTKWAGWYISGRDGVVEREPAAVHVDDLAGHVAGGVAEQEADDVGDLLGLAQALHRRAPEDALAGGVAG